MSGLPRLLVLTDRLACERQGRNLIDTVGAAVDAGAEAVVFREKDLPTDQRTALAGALRDIVPHLIVASDLELADAVGADGVHLAAHDPWPDEGRLAQPDGAPTEGRGPAFVIGRSCHSASEVRDADASGATYVTLSPIFPTPSKPGYGPALGTEAMAAGRTVGDDANRVSVYALGGVTPAVANACIDAGAAGVAVMGAIMAAPDPGVVVRRMHAALGLAPSN